MIVVAYQSGRHLEACIAALLAQTLSPTEIIIFDNASTDGAPGAVALAYPQVRLLESGTNLGFAAGNNRGAATAKAPWLALINPDAVAEPDWLEKMLAATQDHPDVPCFGSRQWMAGKPGILDGLGDVMSLAGFPYRGGYDRPDPGRVRPGEIFSACGGAMLVDRATFVAMGGFDERLFCYCEDVDLGYRLRLAGRATRLVPEASVIHVGGTASGGARSDFAVFHGTRNRLWVFVKNTPPVLFWLTLPLHLLTTLVLFVRHLMRGEVKAPWLGLIAGLAGLGPIWLARGQVRRAKGVSSWTLARAMTWNPLDLICRRVVIKRPRHRLGKV